MWINSLIRAGEPAILGPGTVGRRDAKVRHSARSRTSPDHQKLADSRRQPASALRAKARNLGQMFTKR